MILRRYGSSVHSVAVDFNPKALTEIRFREYQQASLPTDEFLADHARVRRHDIAATAEGEVVLIESEQGTDYPKTCTQQRTVVEGIENRLHFTSSVRPPLRIGVYRKKGG